MSIVAVILVLLLGLLALVAAGLVWLLCRPLPQTQGTVRLSNLKDPVEVLRDRWGVPHIYANSEDDLFFAQGYVHAQERMWQMELQRRVGSGRLSEVLGEVTLEVDRFFRVVGLNRAAEAEAEALDDETRQALEAYAAGVNAYLKARKGRLSAEFALLRFEPEPWRPVDSLYWTKVMSWNLSCNWASELIRARLAGKLGADLATDLEPIFPADNPPIVPGKGLPEGADLPPNGWRSEALRDALKLVEDLFRPNPSAAESAPHIPGVTPAPGNSNQWVVAGQRSATGQPLLANDTHMLLQIPAIWYQVHLVGGDYNVTGVSLPGLPGVLIGHNQHCAWGMTTAWQDEQDLYIERLKPDNTHHRPGSSPRDAPQGGLAKRGTATPKYEYKGEWLDAEVIHEEIRVKGQEQPVVQEVIITRHGPIISDVIGEETPLALRWVAQEPSAVARSALRYDRARNWEEFRAALDDWSTPGHNYVYADVEGNIGFLQAGWAPIRERGYGLAPVPGWTGEYEWQGRLPLDELPQTTNPESGWLATANHLVVDDDYPHFLSGDLENPCRARRLVDLLATQETFTADDFARFQRDTYSAQAERFVQHLLAVEPQNKAVRRAVEVLGQWDYRLEPESVAASIYQVSRLRALHLVFDSHLEEIADAYVGLDTFTALGGATPYHARSFVRLLDLLDGNGDDVWLQDPASGQPRAPQALLHQALEEALSLLEAELGPDVARWEWGRINRVHFSHPVGSVKPLHLLFNRGPYPASGDQDTMLRSIGKPEFPFEPVAVADALRFIADVSDWEKCRIVIPGGQSGHIASRHYADLIPLWREGRFQPMPFAREQVERHAKQRLMLVPDQET